MEFLYHWGLFSAEMITTVISVLILIIGIVAILASQKKSAGRLTVKPLNDEYEALTHPIRHATTDKKTLKKDEKSKAKKHKSAKSEHKPRLFVIDFKGDIKASAVTGLRECITAVLLSKQDNDQVLIRLESPGGAVHCYGLAASQLERLRTANVPVTVAVDKVAASGGYMMACVANHIIAAPFAVIGSIGVVYQLPNFNRLLHKNNIEYEQLTAGEYKRTLTMFGENTKQDREKVQTDINETQLLFKQHIKHCRPDLDIDSVATGEHWYGRQAIDLNLIDTLQTSDDFLLQAQTHFDIYALHFKEKKKLGKKITEGMSAFSAKWLEFSRYVGS